MKEVVCGVIMDGGGRILACRRGFDRHLGGLWEFPGGKVDHGESHEAALERELAEELGIAVSVGERIGPVVEWTDGNVSIRLQAFRCGILKGEARALEHEEILWCDAGQLSGLDWAEADLPIVKDLSESFSGEFR